LKISELSRTTGVTVPTIKFYLRERLLPAGQTTARNQAVYDELHVERLRLIRTLVEIGGVNLAGVRAIVDAIDDQDLPLHGLFRVVHRTLHTTQSFTADRDGSVEGRDVVDKYIDALEWQVDEDAPGRDAVAAAMLALRRFGWDCDIDILQPYAEAAERLAAYELEAISPDTTRAAAAANVVIGTIVFESALVALRRMAEEHHSAIRFGRE